MRFGKQFWKEAFERGIKSAAQGAATGALADAAFNIADVSQLKAIALGALTMFVLSVVTSIASAPIGPEDSASLVETPTT